jgi:glycosyltransferase involved in cell wall biosynthesis
VIACNYVRQHLNASNYTVPDNRIHTIVLGVDTNLFTPSTQPIGSKRLFHAASLIAVKDQPTLLRTIAHLPDDVTLDIAGEGEARTDLLHLAHQLGIVHRVRFLGTIAYTEMPAYYQEAALHVLSSRHEALGMVTLEAAACAIPTVSTAVGLLPDFPEMGVSVPVGDDKALADTIHMLLNDSSRRIALGQSARKIVETEFTINHTVTQFERLYEQVMKG